jgi:alkanesulfonate monooxygenase
MMPTDMLDARLEVFSTCPPSSGSDPGAYVREVADVARWSEEAGCRGILVYADNSLVDPWLVSQVIIQNTTSLCPLVAVQPVYMHPYAVAKMVASLGHLHGRRIYLNMVAGGFRNDLNALCDPTPHDRRYQRLIEYTRIIKGLLEGEAPVSLDGEFYKVDKLKLLPPLPRQLFPGIFASGSSEAGVAAAAAIGATAIQYPQPVQECRTTPVGNGLPVGIRVGIIARADERDAWDIARARFPEDRKGQLAHQLAMKVSDSVWHRHLSEMNSAGGTSPYWLVPFQNYKTMCPYLVGSYDRVGAELEAYAGLGYGTYILDVPRDPEDLGHARMAFQRALEISKCRKDSRTG